MEEPLKGIDPNEIKKRVESLGYVRQKKVYRAPKPKKTIHQTSYRVTTSDFAEPSGCYAPTAHAFDLNWYNDRRGGLVEIYRQEWASERSQYAALPLFNEQRVRQVYISATYPGVAKGWHVHCIQTDRFCVVRGAVQIVMIDLLCEDPAYITQTLDVRRGPRTVVIPPGYAHGWVALDHPDGESWVINMCSHQYDGLDEYRKSGFERPRPDISPFNWNPNIAR